MPSEPTVYCLFDFEYDWVTVRQGNDYYASAYASNTSDGLTNAQYHFNRGLRDLSLFGVREIAIPLELFSIVGDTNET
jgi:hypothetical protein